MNKSSAMPDTSAVVAPLAGEPRWPAILAILATAALHFVLPEPLRFGPGWLLLVVVSLLLIPAVLAHRAGRLDINRVLGHLVLGSLTASMVWSLALLIWRLPEHRDTPQILLRAAVTLWVANVLVFASWYWRLDAGGPNERDRRDTHGQGAFLFPQMLMPGKHTHGWRPGFVDYLFLAFNTSTAFSPTDVPVLSRWAKLMMMVQASISLATVALIAARAVNIL
ncbi:MAG TPA: hypothetical protein VLW25_13390 [Bryobacteraceae bacterium]|nr:hypothetical protein [Bryobacteraceae bacterium]